MLGFLGNLLSLNYEPAHRSVPAGLALRRSSGSRRLWRTAALNYRSAPPVKGGTMTRQRRRAVAFAQAFREITRKFDGEPRAARRRMARALAKRSLRMVAAAGGAQ